MKKREFRNLCQGNRTIGQYVDEFSKLSRYAPDGVATDAVKQEKFMEGLNDEMSMQLMGATFNNYQVWARMILPRSSAEASSNPELGRTCS